MNKVCNRDNPHFKVNKIKPKVEYVGGFKIVSYASRQNYLDFIHRNFTVLERKVRNK